MIAAILMAVVMVFAQFGSAAASGTCDGAMVRPAVERGHHQHIQMGAADHAAMQHDGAHHHTAAHPHPCCTNGCLACVPAILTTDAGIPVSRSPFAFAAASDTFEPGLSPSPPLGPPRSRI